MPTGVWFKVARECGLTFGEFVVLETARELPLAPERICAQAEWAWTLWIEQLTEFEGAAAGLEQCLRRGLLVIQTPERHASMVSRLAELPNVRLLHPIASVGGVDVTEDGGALLDECWTRAGLDPREINHGIGHTEDDTSYIEFVGSSVSQVERRIEECFAPKRTTTTNEIVPRHRPRQLIRRSTVRPIGLVRNFWWCEPVPGFAAEAWYVLGPPTTGPAAAHGEDD